GGVARLLGLTPEAARKQARLLGLRPAGLGRSARYPRASVETLLARSARGNGVQTANYYLAALKGFCRWLVTARRMAENPVAHLRGGNAKLDRRHDRRELPVGELVSVLEAARRSVAAFRGLAGDDRFHVYLTACGRGFRAGELAGLTPESFGLDAAPAVVRLPPAVAKNRKRAIQPLPSSVAAALRLYLAAKPAGRPVWPGTWAED